MRIEQMDRAVVKKLAEHIEMEVKSIAESYGLSARYAGGNYVPSNATLKFELAVIGGDGQVKDRMAEDWKLLAPMFGFKSDDLGAEFVSGGKSYRIVGWKAGASKFPIVGERLPDGKRFKFQTESVKVGLAIPAVAVSVKRARVVKGGGT